MKRVWSCSSLLTLALLLPGSGMAVDVKTPGGHLTADQIVERNVAARGGLSAWRAVQTISFSGTMDAGGKPEAELPFVLEMKRGGKSRLELQFAGQTALQVYDGTNGWKLRPFLNRHDVEPFSADEQLEASTQSLDGLLIDYAAKGTKLELLGTEKVGPREAYLVKLTCRNGQVRRDWIDAESFLEIKMEGSPRRMDGKLHAVAVYFDQYRSAPGGLLVPYQLETKVEGVKETRKINIASVVVNPPADDKLFARPE